MLRNVSYVFTLIAIENHTDGMQLTVVYEACQDLLRALLRISAYRKEIRSSGILRDTSCTLSRSLFCV